MATSSPGALKGASGVVPAKYVFGRSTAPRHELGAVLTQPHTMTEPRAIDLNAIRPDRHLEIGTPYRPPLHGSIQQSLQLDRGHLGAFTGVGAFDSVPPWPSRRVCLHDSEANRPGGPLEAGESPPASQRR